MPITPEQQAAAQAVQYVAAHDAAAQVRVVAGPGTGKSYAIEERVRWLLEQGADPTRIWGVSFTRAAALDLRQRVHQYCQERGLPMADQVRVSTLHSLALRSLRAAGLLQAYPAVPLVLDQWELENVFDAEFGESEGYGTERRRQIRAHHEAFWSTGQWDPPNYVPPSPPITEAERARFEAFHGPRTQAYACVLPGEIVRKCVEYMNAGALNPVALLNMSHLIVDEFQDLNPLDLDFVDGMIIQGAVVFVAGDDDQSIYSFRFASPAGIQNFPGKYPGSGQHTLTACFRCTPTILNTATSLIQANSPVNRIPKAYSSLWSTAVPPVHGIVHRWIYPNGYDEARGTAVSCQALINAGIRPRDILILLSNKRILRQPIEEALEDFGVAFEGPNVESFLDTEAGRLVLSLVRIVCDANDYVAHRVVLGLLPGVGPGTCNAACQSVFANNQNYRAIFHAPLPAGLLRGRALSAVNRARDLVAQIAEWNAADTLEVRLEAVAGMVRGLFGDEAEVAWRNYAAPLPGGTKLEELRDFLWADTDEQQATLLEAVLRRLNQPVPDDGLLPPRVRIMTMHGAKGLSARVVFVPGLEEEIFPGPRRQPYPGLIMEAARLLYVSITRGRATCIVSYADRRLVYGNWRGLAPSRFIPQLGGAFANRGGGLTPDEVQQITEVSAQL